MSNYSKTSYVQQAIEAMKPRIMAMVSRHGHLEPVTVDMVALHLAAEDCGWMCPVCATRKLKPWQRLAYLHYTLGKIPDQLLPKA